MLRIPDLCGWDQRANRTERVEALATIELAPAAFLLPPAGRDIVRHAIRQHACERPIHRHILHRRRVHVRPALRAHDHAQLALKVHLRPICTGLGDHDVLAIQTEAGKIFREEHGPRGHIRPLLLCMLDVVATNADDVANRSVNAVMLDADAFGGAGEAHAGE